MQKTASSATSSEYYNATNNTNKITNNQKFTRFGSKEKYQTANSLAKCIKSQQQSTNKPNTAQHKKSLSHLRQFSSRQKIIRKIPIITEEIPKVIKQKSYVQILQQKGKQLMKLAKNLNQTIQIIRHQLKKFIASIKIQFSHLNLDEILSSLNLKLIQYSYIIDEKISNKQTNKNVMLSNSIIRKHTISTEENQTNTYKNTPFQNQYYQTSDQMLYNQFILSNCINASDLQVDYRNKSYSSREKNKQTVGSAMKIMQHKATDDGNTPLLTKQCKFVRTNRKNNLIGN